MHAGEYRWSTCTRSCRTASVRFVTNRIIRYLPHELRLHVDQSAIQLLWMYRVKYERSQLTQLLYQRGEAAPYNDSSLSHDTQATHQHSQPKANTDTLYLCVEQLRQANHPRHQLALLYRLNVLGADQLRVRVKLQCQAAVRGVQGKREVL